MLTSFLKARSELPPLKKRHPSRWAVVTKALDEAKINYVTKKKSFGLARVHLSANYNLSISFIDGIRYGLNDEYLAETALYHLKDGKETHMDEKFDTKSFKTSHALVVHIKQMLKKYNKS